MPEWKSWSLPLVLVLVAVVLIRLLGLTLGYVLLAASGFGFVIAIHEFGHFVFAKWAGVRVDVFSIGFGPKILTRRWGETEYALSVLPFGGYVKMLGQEDVPGDLDPTMPQDPRSFLAKPFAWRAAIMLGGVLFNFLSSFLILLGLALHGMPVIPPLVGQVEPVIAGAHGTTVDSPATRVGLRQGDEILTIDGQRVRSFDDIATTVVIDARSPLHLTVRRRHTPGTLSLPLDGASIRPVYAADLGMPALGIQPPLGNRLGLVASSSAAALRPEVGERLVAFGSGAEAMQVAQPGGQPLCGQEIARLLVPWIGRELPMTLARDGSQRTITVPYAGVIDDGVVGGFPAVITTVFDDEAAAKAGVRPGDFIAAVDGAPVTADDVLVALQDGLEAHHAVDLTLERPDAHLQTTRLTLHVPGDAHEGGTWRIGVKLGAKITGRLPILPTLHDGAPTPLARALAAKGYGPGTVVVAVEQPPLTSDASAILQLELWVSRGGESMLHPLDEHLVEEMNHVARYPFWASWFGLHPAPALASQLSGVRVTRVLSPGQLEVEPPGKTAVHVDASSLEAAGVHLSDWLTAGDWITGLTTTASGPALEILHGPDTTASQLTLDPGVMISFDHEEVPYRVHTPADAVALVTHTSYNMVVHTLQLLPRFFRSPDAGGVNPNKTLAGPVSMFRMLKHSVELFGFGTFLRFVALIGLNLFLINLLPIPITDGGQLMVMTIEAVIGRPLPMVIRQGLQYLGLLLVVSLMLYVLGLDLSRP